MPSSYYHLKFELYPTPHPAANEGKGAEADDHIWIPPPGSSIFEDLPAHPRKAAGRSRNPIADKSHFTYPAVGVIDCGTTRASKHDDDDRNLVILSERQWRERSESLPTPSFTSGIGPRTALRDWRFGPLNIESFDLDGGDSKRDGNHMDATDNTEAGREPNALPAASLGPNLGGPGQATKARYIPLETKNTEIGWGIVHLYRESGKTRALGSPSRPSSGGGAPGADAPTEDECTILCIPSVPSYLSPSDFLGFVGEKWRGDVSHYRMVMTSKMNRYMVLMKFRDHRRAKEWRSEFDGKIFNSMEAEICHVTFIKSITVETPAVPDNGRSSEARIDASRAASSSVVSSLKPFPPPTPDLTELPTCTVCLERMDDTTGLMTILCQHVFHCTCLQTWKGSGCPVCRATNPSLVAEPGLGQNTYDRDNTYAQPFGTGVSNLCSVCDCTSDLWICLICGYLGCGRYKGGHAKDHWKETAHGFSLELETQHVWDYAGDMWVHRLIRDKGDGKVVELPSNNDDRNSDRRRPRPGNGWDDGGSAENEDVVPRAKLDRIGMEYTHLLTSQLESQRVYFEEMVSKAADKAAKAAAVAEAAAAQAQEATRALSALRTEHRALKEDAIPSLERELARECSRASRSTELARSLGRSLQEEKKVSEGLMQRIEHVHKELGATRQRVDELRAENEELKETNRDLTMFISGQERLKELESEGKVGQSELEEGKVSLPEEKRKGKGKARGKR